MMSPSSVFFGTAKEYNDAEFHLVELGEFVDCHGPFAERGTGDFNCDDARQICDIA